MLRANGIRNWVRSNTWQETLQIMESGGNVNFVQEKKSLTDVMATMLFAATYLYVNRLGRLMLSLPFPLTHTVRDTFMSYGAPSDLQTLFSFTGAYGFIN